MSKYRKKTPQKCPNTPQLSNNRTLQRRVKWDSLGNGLMCFVFEASPSSCLNTAHAEEHMSATGRSGPLRLLSPRTDWGMT